MRQKAGGGPREVMERDIGLKLHRKGWKEKWVEGNMEMKGGGIGRRLYRKRGR